MVLEQISQSEKFITGGTEAATALMANREKVVMDIVNPKPKTQMELERVHSSDKPGVDEMFAELCGRLQGKAGAKKPSAQNAGVWAVAARYLAKRVQGTAEAMPGRKADMSPGAARAMRVVLGQIATEADEIADQNGAIEASQRLQGNRDKVVKDIVNPTPITQRGLLRVDSKHETCVNAMIAEVCNRLEKKATRKPSAQEAPVWATAAEYLSARIQGSPAACPGRKADMSVYAAKALHAVLAQIRKEAEVVSAWNGANEAAQLLKANRERVAQDIANSGRKNIDGHGLTQPSLARVDSKHKTVVDAMLVEVCNRLEGKGGNSKPSTSEEISVWVTAAAYLSHRVQGAAAECPGRKPDMSAGAAKALKEVLGKIEAGYKLEANRVRVVQDITNSGPTNIDGKSLTQTELKRVDSKNRAIVEAMIGEVCNYLQGKAATKKPSAQEASVWAAAATYLSKRVQGSNREMPGRNADMSVGAATALRSALEAVAGDGAARKEAAQALKANQKKVVADIVNPGPKNIDGIVLTQRNLDRVDNKHQAAADAMINEVCGRLQGTGGRKPSTSEEAIVWAAAASYLSKRVQGSPTDMPGRKPDMSYAAAAALRAVLVELC
jgi:surfactin synthase thioesterase subunit